MRYTVRAAKGNTIENIFSTNDEPLAIKKEKDAKGLGYDEVWVCDSVTELQVG